MLEFEREGDRCFILDNGPWTHRGDPFPIVPFDGHGRPGDVVMDCMPIWGRIYDVPPRMLSKEVGWELGRKLGKVFQVDADKNGRLWSEFIHVRVEHDVNEHLLHEIHSERFSR